MNHFLKLHAAPPAMALVLLAGCGAGTGDDQAGAVPPGMNPPAGDTARAPAPASARPTMGEIVTRVDGRESSWQILAGVPGDELRRPSASIADHGPMMLLSLQGTSEEDRSRQATLSATLMSQGDDLTVTSQEMFILPEGARGPMLEGRELEIEWSRLELDRSGGQVEGRFTGFACPSGSATGSDEGCLPLEGSFRSEVGHDEVVQGVLDDMGGLP